MLIGYDAAHSPRYKSYCKQCGNQNIPQPEDIPISSPNPLCCLTSCTPAFISRNTLFLTILSVTIGSGMATNNKAVQAIKAPATSSNITTVMLKEVINKAPKAGPAILHRLYRLIYSGNTHQFRLRSQQRDSSLHSRGVESTSHTSQGQQ